MGHMAPHPWGDQVIEAFTLAVLAAVFSIAARDTTKSQPVPTPGLSSQAAQIKPLTPAQIALGKKAYLGPKRERKVKIPKRHQPT